MNRFSAMNKMTMEAKHPREFFALIKDAPVGLIRALFAQRRRRRRRRFRIAGQSVYRCSII